MRREAVRSQWAAGDAPAERLRAVDRRLQEQQQARPELRSVPRRWGRAEVARPGPGSAAQRPELAWPLQEELFALARLRLRAVAQRVPVFLSRALSPEVAPPWVQPEASAR